MSAVAELPPPPVFAGRPEFGNLEQIKMLRAYERDCEQIEEEEREGLGLAEWEVEINFSGVFHTTVKAHDEEEARELAQNKFDVGEADVDTDNISVTKLGGSHERRNT